MNTPRRIIWAAITCALLSTPVAALTNLPALWVAGDDDDALDWSGSENTADGLVHSNGGIKLGGSGNTINGDTRWVSKFKNGGGDNKFVPAPIQVQASAWPFSHQLSDYLPGGRAALAAGAQYFNETSVCNQEGKWQQDVQGSELVTGLYWVPCDVVLNASNLTGHITVVSTGKVKISGSRQSDLRTFIDGVLFMTDYAGHDAAIKLSGSGSSLNGFLIASEGRIKLSGSDLNLTCGLLAQNIKQSGSKINIVAEGCAVPEAVGEPYTIPENTQLDINLTGVDLDNDLLTVQIVDPPQHGLLSEVGGQWTYTPNMNYVGDDALTYRVSDGIRESNIATVSIVVTPVNDAPVADSLSLSVSEDSVLLLQLSGHDVDGDSLSYIVTSLPQHGTLSGTEPSLTYQPTANYFGQDTISYFVNDGTLNSTVVDVTITVLPVNDQPVSYDQALQTDSTVALAIELTGSDIDQDELIYQLVSSPQHGNLSGQGANWVFTPDPHYGGPDAFQYRVNDGGLNSEIAVIEIEISRETQAPGEGAGGENGTPDEMGNEIDFIDGGDEFIDDIEANNVPLFAQIEPGATLNGITISDGTNTIAIPESAISIGGDGGVSVSGQDVSGLKNGTLTATMGVTDLAGNIGAVSDVTELELSVLNSPPQISSSPLTTVNERAPYQYEVVATDPDGDELTFALEDQPNGMTIDSNTGAISWLADSAYVQGSREHNNLCQTVAIDTGSAIDQPDLAVFDILYDESLQQLSAVISNRGLMDVDQAFEVKFYYVDSQLGEPLTGSVNILQLAANQTVVATLNSVSVAGLIDHIFVVIDANNIVEECLEDNNHGIAALVKIQVSDSSGESDNQTFLLNVHDVNEAPVITNYLEDDTLASSRLLTIDDPVLYLAFEGDFQDSSDFDNHANIDPRSSGVVTTVPSAGVFGDALSISNGLAWLVVNDSPSLSINEAITMSAWVNPTGQVGNNSGIYFKGELISRQPDWQVVVGDVGTGGNSGLGRSGAAASINGNGFATSDAGITDFDFLNPLPANTWTHIAATFDGEVLRLFVNGTPVGVDYYTGPLDTSNTKLYIGNRFRASGDVGGLQGLMDELKIYDRALPQSDIEILSNNLVAFSHQVQAEDPDTGDVLSYSLENAHAGMTIDSQSGLIEWTTGIEQNETINFSVVVTDLAGAEDRQHIQLHLTVDDNIAPEILTDPPLFGEINETYEYAVSAQDADGTTPLTYSLESAPTGMTISTDGQVIWVPGIADLGEHEVHIGVSDGSAQLIQRYTLTIVEHLNYPPNIYSTPVTQIELGQTYGYAVLAEDDNDEFLQYQLHLAPEGMSINPETGYVSWHPNEVGSETVVINAIDSEGLIDNQGFEVTVNPVSDECLSPDDNQELIGICNAPYFKYLPNQIAVVDELYSYQPVMKNEFGVTLDFELILAPNDMSIDSQTGLVQWQPDVSQVGLHRVMIQANSGQYPSIAQDYTIIVYPTLDYAFSIISSPALSTLVDAQYNYFIIVDNSFSGDVRYELEQAPSGMLISDGVITWIPGAQNIGQHAIRITAINAYGLRDTQQFTLDVDLPAGPNHAPEITSTPDFTATVDTSYNYDVQATDADGDMLTYSLLVFPTGMGISSGNGTLSWTPSVADVGEHTVSVRVTDSADAYATQSYSLFVTDQPNEAPVISSLPPFNAKVSYEYRYQVLASDSDNDVLSFSLIQGPTGMTMATNGLLIWTPTKSGQEPLTVRVSDGQAYTEQSWIVNVFDADAPLSATIEINPASPQLGDTIFIRVTPTGAVGVPTVSVTVDEVTVQADSNGDYIVLADTLGTHQVVVTVADTHETISKIATYTVIDPTSSPAPVVILTTPSDNSILTTPSDIIGSVSDDNLSRWFVALKRSGAPANEFVTLVEGTTTITESVLGQLDTTQLLNGQYNVILQAEDASGNISSASSVVMIGGDLKVGNFSFTVLDLDIPLLGIPIQVNRTYDSRRRLEGLDFGYGWSIDYQNIKLDESRTPGKFWVLNEYHRGPLGLIVDFCVEPQGAPVVSVTLPDGVVETFEAEAFPRCHTTLPQLDVELQFRATGDTSATLEALNDNFARLTNGHLIEVGFSTEPINPSRYKMTTRSGYEYYLDQAFGIEFVIDPNGNRLTYTDDGIFHSSGKAITFNRNSLGRITSITDPMGNILEYGYDLSGDLQNATDTAGAQTRYTYNNRHGLIDIIDPLGRTVVKNIYDDDDRLIAQEDSDGNRTEFVHDIEGRFSLVTDRNGSNTQYYYDDEGNILTQIDALGNTSSFTYDERGNQLSQTDALGNVSSATYNTNNDQLTAVDSMGNATAFAYNQRGQETKITDALSNVFTISYDIAGNLLGVADPDGNLAGNNIDFNGNVTRTVDVLGYATDFSYDADGNKLTETDALSNITIYTYDDNGNVLSETRSRSTDAGPTDETTTYEYDARNRVVRTADAEGNFTRTEYNLAGHETARINALGRRTEMEYDAYGRVITIIYPDGTTEYKTYDPEGNLLTGTNRLGDTTQYSYDELNRLTQTVQPDGAIDQTEYDAVGRVSAEIDANGNRTEYGYDTAGRRTLVRDALGNEHHYAYDANGNLVSEIDARGNSTTYRYNALDQRIDTTYADDSVMADTLDALSRRTAQTDQVGVTINYAYDSLGRLSGVTDVLSNLTAFDYDEAGNQVSQTDANGHITLWSHDAFGRITDRILPMGQRELLEYDANGNLIRRVDFNGQSTDYQYDTNDRLVGVNFADGRSEVHQYDAMGQRTETSQTDTLGNVRTMQWQYDNRGRLVQETQANGTTLNYLYDAVGNRTQLSLTPSASGNLVITTSYAYDALNRLQSVTDDTGGITSYGYDEVGNRTSISYPNGVSQIYAYDDLNRLTRLEHYNASGALTQRYDYKLHATGRRTGIDELNGRSTVYGYDSLYRLTKEAITDPLNVNFAASYQYDNTGNRTYSTIDGISTAYTYDANDRLVQQGSTTYAYDANGNTLSETLDGAKTTYIYNAQDQLISHSQGDTANEYWYNSDGIRNQKTETVGGSDTTTDYLVDSNRDYAQVLAEYTNGTQTVVYTYGDDLISQRRTSESGQPDTSRYFLYDGLGSTRALGDESGNISDSYDYDAFGVELNHSGSADNAYRFAGEQLDQNLDQYYLRARYYDQSIGRFGSMDTWTGNNSDPVTLHKYAYGNLDPVNNNDPTGNFSLASFGAANNIRVELATLGLATVSLGFSQFDEFSFDSDVFTDVQRGWLILMTMNGTVTQSLAQLILKKDVDEDSARTAGKNRVLADIDESEKKFGNKKRAIIGENQSRVSSAAIYYKAITLKFDSPYQYQGKLKPHEVALSLAYNYGWVRALRANNFSIFDIGADKKRAGPTSLWYTIELTAVRGYEKHYKVSWP